ncbi:MAG: DUF1553 domain-containing protein [Planctomycetaceae bacterium]
MSMCVEVANPDGECRADFITVPDSCQSVCDRIAGETLKSTSSRKRIGGLGRIASESATARVYVNPSLGESDWGRSCSHTGLNFGKPAIDRLIPNCWIILRRRLWKRSWSTKKLIRRICLSRTFRMSAAGSLNNSKQIRITACWREPSVADLMQVTARFLMQISGILDLSVLSGRTIAKLSTYDNEYRHAAYPLRVRSVYVPSFRNSMLDLFEIFDGANPNLVTGKRTRSTRPAQALYVHRQPIVMEQAKLAAENFLKSPGSPRATPKTVFDLHGENASAAGRQLMNSRQP